MQCLIDYPILCIFQNLPNLTVLEISNSPLTRFDVAAVDGIANVTLPLHYHDCSYCGFQRFRDALIARSLSPGIQAKADSYQCMVSNATFVGWLRLVDLDDSAFDPCDGDDAQFTPAPTKCLASELPEEEVLIEPESKALPLVADRLKAVPAGNHTSVPPPPIPMSSSTTSSESSTSPFFSYRLQQELSMNVATLLRDVSQHGGGDSSSDDQATTDYASVFAEIVRALGGATGGGGSSCRDRQPPVLIFKGDSGEGGDNGIPGRKRNNLCVVFEKKNCFSHALPHSYTKQDWTASQASKATRARAATTACRAARVPRRTRANAESVVLPARLERRA